MTEVAYMIREDWAQHGTAMLTNSTKIRDWLGAGPYTFAVTSDRLGHPIPSEADEEVVRYLGSASKGALFTALSDLSRLQREGGPTAQTLVLLHPYKETDCDIVREVIASGDFRRVYVQIWAPTDRVRIILDSLHATNLHLGVPAPFPDQVILEAARMIEDVSYNGLGSGHGKDLTIRLLRTLRDAGYSLDEKAWLHAFFAAGGKARHAESLSKYISEMNRGVQHRVKEQGGHELLAHLRKRDARAQN